MKKKRAISFFKNSW